MAEEVALFPSMPAPPLALLRCRWRHPHRARAARVLAGAREAPAGGCSSSGRGSDGKCTLLINRSVVTSPSSLRTSTSAQIAQTAERQLCSRRGLTGDADAAARTAPVGRDGMCTPASRLGPQGGSGRGEQAKVTFTVVLPALWLRFLQGLGLRVCRVGLIL